MVSDIGNRTEQDDLPAKPSDPPRDGEESYIEAVIDPRLDKLIGRSLQAHYADIVSAPLPDTILVLLAQLEARETSA